MRFSGPWPRCLGLLTIAGNAGFSAGQAGAAPAAGGKVATTKPCIQLARFDDDDFPRQPRITSRFLPLIPGTKTTLEGNVEGVPHRVEFVVTDLVKRMAGVRTLVIWDTDTSEDEVVESELSFFAQDDDGNVWNLGEYPEEFEGGEFVGAPSTWITGQDGAKAGIHMPALPRSELPPVRPGIRAGDRLPGLREDRRPASNAPAFRPGASTT